MTEMVSFGYLLGTNAMIVCGVVDCDEWPREVLSLLSLAHRSHGVFTWFDLRLELLRSSETTAHDNNIIATK